MEFKKILSENNLEINDCIVYRFVQEINYMKVQLSNNTWLGFDDEDHNKPQIFSTEEEVNKYLDDLADQDESNR